MSILIPLLCSKCHEVVSQIEANENYAGAQASGVFSPTVHICRKADGKIDKAAMLSPYQICSHGIWNGDCPEHDPLKEYAEQEGWKYKEINSNAILNDSIGFLFKR